MNVNDPVARALLDFARQIDPSEPFPSHDPCASRLIARDPYAFAMALCLHRQTKVETIWTIPHDIQLSLGHLDPARIAAMTLADLERLFRRLPHKPRFVNSAPKTVSQLSTTVVREFGGDASGMWRDRPAAQVKATFRRIYGVGPQIANLSVLLIEQLYHIRFSDIDHRYMNIKADIHTRRVLQRLGVAEDDSEEAAIAAAQQLHPTYPGELDAPLWVIGRTWCHAVEPMCRECALAGVCSYAAA